MNETAEVNHDPSTILCRIVDVNTAIQKSFQKFLETESKTLDDLASFLRDELAQLELFAPQIAQEKPE
jgi:hypothetical protein